MKQPIIPIAHMFDNRYVIPAAAAFLSMLTHANKKYFYKLYVLHTDISHTNQEKLNQIVARFQNASLEFIDMHNKLDDMFAMLGSQAHYSKEVLYKLLLPSLFPQYNKIILTDVDVVYDGDIAPSWDMVKDNEDFYMAGVRPLAKPDTFLTDLIARYKKTFTDDEISRLDLCGGYLIFNLDAMRRNNIEGEFLKCLTRDAWRLLQSEQDVLNLVCPMDKKIYLPLNNIVCSYAYDLYDGTDCTGDMTYEATDIQDALTHPVQIHYATAIKPWNTLNCTKSDRWYYWLTQTPFWSEHAANIMNLIYYKKMYWLGGIIPGLRVKKQPGYESIRLFGVFKLRKKS
ncbi:MAG: hypothetical protein NC311_00360 [Muribaculaceae bacterium]|nr:hypothetical protein [Muribaculaceae bacterium]